MSEKCPKCGADRDTGEPGAEWKCGTFLFVGREEGMDAVYHQSDKCRIAELEAENEALRAKHCAKCNPQLCEKCDKELRESVAQLERGEGKPYTMIAAKELARLTAALHAARAHPDYEYMTAPKLDNPVRPWLADNGWELCPEWASTIDECWRRRIPANQGE